MLIEGGVNLDADFWNNVRFDPLHIAQCTIYPNRVFISPSSYEAGFILPLEEQSTENVTITYAVLLVLTSTRKDLSYCEWLGYVES